MQNSIWLINCSGTAPNVYAQKPGQSNNTQTADVRNIRPEIALLDCLQSKWRYFWKDSSHVKHNIETTWNYLSGNPSTTWRQYLGCLLCSSEIKCSLLINKVLPWRIEWFMMENYSAENLLEMYVTNKMYTVQCIIKLWSIMGQIVPHYVVDFSEKFSSMVPPDVSWNAMGCG